MDNVYKSWLPLWCFLLIMVLVGCSRQPEGIIYITANSRLSMAVDSEYQIKDIVALNKSAKVLLENIEWKGKEDLEVLARMVEELKKEPKSSNTIYLDVFSESKNWETTEIDRLSEHFADHLPVGAEEENKEVQRQAGLKGLLEIRRLRDLDAYDKTLAVETSKETDIPVVKIGGGKETDPKEEIKSGEDQTASENETSELDLDGDTESPTETAVIETSAPEPVANPSVTTAEETSAASPESSASQAEQTSPAIPAPLEPTVVSTQSTDEAQTVSAGLETNSESDENVTKGNGTVESENESQPQRPAEMEPLTEAGPGTYVPHDDPSGPTKEYGPGM